MRNWLVVVPLALVACSFQAQIGGGATPPPQTPANADPTPAPAPAPNVPATATTPNVGAKNPLAGVKIGAAAPPPPFDPRVRPTFNGTSAASSIPLVTTQTDFGGPKPDSDSMTGIVFFLPGPVDKLPELSTVQPTGRLFSRTFSVGPQANGFPGIVVGTAAPRTNNFAVRYSGSFNVAKAGDYSLYLDSREGARLSIDGQVAIDNDGVHGRTFKNADFTWTAGTHTLVLDYFSGPTNDVTLELFVSPKGAPDSARVWSPQVAF